MFTAVCVHLDGLNAEHKFRVWVTILGHTFPFPFPPNDVIRFSANFYFWVNYSFKGEVSESVSVEEFYIVFAFG